MRRNLTGEILFYHKHEIQHLGAYRRTVWLSRSMDFENWTEPELVFSADELDDAEYRTSPEQSTDVYLGCASLYSIEVE